MPLLVDTGSSWTWTYVDSCIKSVQTCPKDNYHIEMGTDIDKSGDEITIEYGDKNRTKGYKTRDTVTLPSNTNIRGRVEFLSVPAP